MEKRSESIYTTLTPDEKAAALARARATHRTLAAHVRHLILVDADINAHEREPASVEA